MEEEEIEDLGDATVEDSLRMVPNIEALNFDPYLVGVLRVLVGVDLLREHDIFWLPEPGEVPPPPRPPSSPRKGDKTAGPNPSSPKAVHRTDQHDAHTGSSLSRRPSIDSITSSRAPMSTAGSGSPTIPMGDSISIRRPPRVPHRPLYSSGSELSPSEDEMPIVKHRKSPLVTRTEEATGRKGDIAAGTDTSTTPKVKPKLPFKARRNRRSGHDNSPFKPGTDVDVSSDEEAEISPTKRRKNGVQRSSKRARVGEEPGDDEKEAKKPRTQLHEPPSTQSNTDAA